MRVWESLDTSDRQVFEAVAACEYGRTPRHTSSAADLQDELVDTTKHVAEAKEQ
jgi:hypothetical protein